MFEKGLAEERLSGDLVVLAAVLCQLHRLGDWLRMAMSRDHLAVLASVDGGWRAIGAADLASENTLLVVPTQPG